MALLFLRYNEQLNVKQYTRMLECNEYTSKIYSRMSVLVGLYKPYFLGLGSDPETLFGNLSQVWEKKD